MALQAFISDLPLSCYYVDTDKYKRTVMQCFVEGADLGVLMVKSGFAKDFRRYSDGFYELEEIFARKSKLGIWK